MTFKHIYNEEKAKSVCKMYSDITKTHDDEDGKVWTMTASFWNNSHKVEVKQTPDGDYTYSIDEGNFTCRFDGDQITIKEGFYNGRKCKADSTLRNFENLSMILYALVKRGKLK